MAWWHGLLCVLALMAGAPALYGLHRLCLWLEQRGWLYYKHKSPSGTSAGCLVALQKALEPQTRHVLHVKEEKRRHSEEEAPGEEGPAP